MMTLYLGSVVYKSWKLTKIMPNSLKLLNHYILSNTPPKIRQWVRVKLSTELPLLTVHYRTKLICDVLCAVKNSKKNEMCEIKCRRMLEILIIVKTVGLT